MKKRKICVVTGSRAEYGLLYWVLRDISDSEDLDDISDSDDLDDLSDSDDLDDKKDSN